MALETLNIDYLKDKNDKLIFPVTHSDAIIGGLSKKGYDINDKVYNNNWDNVITAGIYYSSAASTATSRPQLLQNTSNVNITYDFIEVIRTGTIAWQIARRSLSNNSINTGTAQASAYRKLTNITNTGAGSKGAWTIDYYTAPIVGGTKLTNVTTDDQTLLLTGITSYSVLDGIMIVAYPDANASAKLPIRIRVNNLAYVPLFNLDGMPVEQDTFESKRVPMLISYSATDSCFYLVRWLWRSRT